jgi:hypothetical protein
MGREYGERVEVWMERGAEERMAGGEDERMGKGMGGWL